MSTTPIIDRFLHAQRQGSILAELAGERASQERKWGGRSVASVSDPSRAVVILTEELGEVARAAHDGDLAHYRLELVQVAAVAVAMIEAVDAGVVEMLSKEPIGLIPNSDRTVICPQCANEQPELGRSVKCNVCGHAPMPYFGENGALIP